MEKTLIIAEAGVNHNGEISLAKELIDVAAEAKADLVKFQTFKAENIVTRAAVKADYQLKNTSEIDNSQFAMLKKLEITEEDHFTLIEYAEKRGISFFSTAFDPTGLLFLNQLGFERFKIPSGELTNYLYLKQISVFGKPVILSTGMASLLEIRDALEVLMAGGLHKSDITVLHCNTEYPTPMQDVNLKAMLTIRDTFDVNVGYSDHTLGIEVPIAAVAMGAKVIEKHFTLNRSLNGPDHRASLEPNELKQMVGAIRNIEMAISGNGLKTPSQSELKNIPVARKSLYFSRPLKKGEKIKELDIIALRPGDGISPMDLPKIVGLKVLKDVSDYEQVYRNIIG